MNRKVTIQLTPQAFEKISTLAIERKESVAHFISQYILNNIVQTAATVDEEKAEKKRQVHSLKGIFAKCAVSEYEAMDEYIKEKTTKILQT